MDTAEAAVTIVLILTLGIAGIAVILTEPPPEVPSPEQTVRESLTVDSLLAAMRRIESGGDNSAVGDGGRSLGPLQIGRAYWQDAIEFAGVDWKYDEHVWDYDRSCSVVRWYWQRYCQESYVSRDFETLARIHNGGPRGAEKNATKKYWRKVERELQR